MNEAGHEFGLGVRVQRQEELVSPCLPDWRVIKAELGTSLISRCTGDNGEGRTQMRAWTPTVASHAASITSSLEKKSDTRVSKKRESTH